MNWVGRTWWELQLSPGWEAQDDPECLSITGTSGGALQLSAAVKTSGEIGLSELEDMRSNETPSGASCTTFNGREFDGLNACFMEDETLWQKYWLSHGNLLIFATYNGLPSDWEQDHSEVVAMLRTLRVKEASNALPA